MNAKAGKVLSLLRNVQVCDAVMMCGEALPSSTTIVSATVGVLGIREKNYYPIL